MPFVFRRPRFPVLLDTGTALLSAKTSTELKTKLSDILFSDESKPRLIDSTAEIFTLHPSSMIVMPKIAPRTTKADMIALYNRMRSAAQPEYKATSLSSKRIERVVADLVQLLSARRRTLP